MTPSIPELETMREEDHKLQAGKEKVYHRLGLGLGQDSAQKTWGMVQGWNSCLEFPSEGLGVWLRCGTLLRTPQ